MQNSVLKISKNIQQPFQSLTQLAVRRSDTSMTSIFDFFMVYSTSTWIALGVSLLIFAFFGIFVHLVEYRMRLSNRVDITDIIWSLTRLQLLQHSRLEFRTKSGWFFVCYFLELKVSVGAL